jgi:type I restriction enzyme M protein
VIEQFTFLPSCQTDERQPLEEKESKYDWQPINNFIKKRISSFDGMYLRTTDRDYFFDPFTKPQVDADNLTVFEHMKQVR